MPCVGIHSMRKHEYRSITSASGFCPSPFLKTEYERIKSFSKKKPKKQKLPKRAEVAYLGPGTNQCRTSRKQRRKRDKFIRKLRGKSRLRVTKSLNKDEMAASPECKQAIKNEADALVQAGT